MIIVKTEKSYMQIQKQESVEMNILQKIKCYFGFHRWNNKWYSTNNYYRFRMCKYCKVCNIKFKGTKKK